MTKDTMERTRPKSKAQRITEEDGVHEGWYQQAKEVKTPDALASFVQHLRVDYDHDYGTICHAIAAAAVAAARCVNADPLQGNITGFQAGCAMWEFVRRWMMTGEGPMRLMRYEQMLFPQYADEFQKTITPGIWEYLQKKAQEMHEEFSRQSTTSKDVLKHLKSVIKGKVPFGYKVRAD